MKSKRLINFVAHITRISRRFILVMLVSWENNRLEHACMVTLLKISFLFSLLYIMYWYPIGNERQNLFGTQEYLKVFLLLFNVCMYI